MASFPSFGSSLSPRAKQLPPFSFSGRPHSARAPPLSLFFDSLYPSCSSAERSPIRCSRIQDGWFSGPNPINSKARRDQNEWLSGFPALSAALIAYAVLLSRRFLNLHFNTLMNKVREACQYAVTVTLNQYNLGGIVVGALFIGMWSFICCTLGRISATKGRNGAPVLYGSGVATMNCCGNRHAPASNCCVPGAREGEASPAQPIFIMPPPAQPIFIMPPPAQPIFIMPPPVQPMFIIPGNNMFFNLNFFSGWGYTGWNSFKF